jgi:hypothetical protein
MSLKRLDDGRSLTLLIIVLRIIVVLDQSDTTEMSRSILVFDLGQGWHGTDGLGGAIKTDATRQSCQGGRNNNHLTKVDLPSVDDIRLKLLGENGEASIATDQIEFDGGQSIRTTLIGSDVSAQVTEAAGQRQSPIALQDSSDLASDLAALEGTALFER